MIYVDTSVVLAHAFAGDRQPPPAMWDEVLVASRLVDYEAHTHAHARGGDPDDLAIVAAVLGRIRFVALADEVLARAREPFPIRVNTRSALHLSTMLHLRTMGKLRLASYDAELVRSAQALSIPLLPL